MGLVVAYHLGDLPGGWLGVDLFFLLSGYLITWILLGDERPAGDLRTFWGRRIRRLLPALILMIVVVSAYASLGGPGIVPAQVRAPGLATIFYTANWQQIVAAHSYFARYYLSNPFQHTWSLAIEEQYYLFWPLILGGLTYAVRRNHRGRAHRLMVLVTIGLGTVSAAWMGLAAAFFGANRAYLGTDTRAWELLAGGAAAMVWYPGSRSLSRRTATLVSALALAGLVGGICAAGGPPDWMWDGGLVGIALCGLALIVVVVIGRDGVFARALSVAPLRWLGRISYSLYLWHWPVIALETPVTTGLTGAPLLAARLATMLSVSCVSYYAVERPLRNLNWSSLGRRVKLPQVAFAGLGIAIAAVTVTASTVGPAHARSATVAPDLLTGPTSAERRQPVDIDRALLGNPYRVWILGDSVMFDGSPGLTAALEATGEVSVVADSAFPGWGLLRDRAWPSDAEHIIASTHPQVVIGTWSWDDDEAYKDPVGYQRSLDAALATVLKPGDGVGMVVLLQFPQAGPPVGLADPPGAVAAWRLQTEMQDAWDGAAARAAAAFPGHAVYLSTDRVFAPGGRYYTWLRTKSGGWVRARKVDGIHMCPYGAAAFGGLVTGDLSYWLALPPLRAGWELGKWNRAPRYDDPAGSCPADQPPPGYTGEPVPG